MESETPIRDFDKERSHPSQLTFLAFNASDTDHYYLIHVASHGELRNLLYEEKLIKVSQFDRQNSYLGEVEINSYYLQSPRRSSVRDEIGENGRFMLTITPPFQEIRGQYRVQGNLNQEKYEFLYLFRNENPPAIIHGLIKQWIDETKNSQPLSHKYLSSDVIEDELAERVCTLSSTPAIVGSQARVYLPKEKVDDPWTRRKVKEVLEKLGCKILEEREVKNQYDHSYTITAQLPELTQEDFLPFPNLEGTPPEAIGKDIVFVYLRSFESTAMKRPFPWKGLHAWAMRKEDLSTFLREYRYEKPRRIVPAPRSKIYAVDYEQADAYVAGKKGYFGLRSDPVDAPPMLENFDPKKHCLVRSTRRIDPVTGDTFGDYAEEYLFLRILGKY